MKTKKLDEANSMVSLALIDPSAFNPRRFFSEVELLELSDNIAQQGVLQPILLRPIGDRYEIVFGERRFRASCIANMKEIPATVRILTDAEAREISITENLQRADVEPLDEAFAFKNLMEIMSYTVADLALKFGKSENYIRGRMRLNNLIAQFGELVAEQVISLASAIELSRYSPEIQEKIYTEHFQDEDTYQSWRELNVKKLSVNIERGYTRDLDNFRFDKSDCLNCPFNSSCNSLFPEPDALGRCSNSTCLNEKNTDYLFAQAMNLAKEVPGMRFYYSHNSNSDLISKLEKEGFEVKQSFHTREYPSRPSEPEFAKGTKKEEKAAVLKEHKRDIERYGTSMNEIQEKLESGKAIQCGRLDANCVLFTYLEIDIPVLSTPDAEIERLKLRDVRNKEIAKENIVGDTKSLIRKTDFSGDFSEIEEKAIYFLMLSTLRNANFEAFGIKGKRFLENADKFEIVEELTEEKKTIIRRDFLVHHLPSVYGTAEQVLTDVARHHAPEKLAEIEKHYFSIYHARQKRLLERIALFKAKKVVELEAS